MISLGTSTEYTMLDLLVIVVIVVSAVRGYVRGALRDLLGLGALVAAYLASRPFGSPLGDFLSARTQLPPGTAYVTARLVAGLAIYVSLSVSAAALNRKAGQDPEGLTRPWNRNLGAFCGLASGLVTALILLFVADSLVKAYPGSTSRALAGARTSRFRRWVSGVNPADDYLLTDLLTLLRIAREDPQVLDRLRDRPEVQQLVNDPEFQTAIRDDELAAALRARDIHAILGNRSFQRLLGNRELIARVLSGDIAAAVRGVVADAEPGGGDAATAPN
jgi:uncharacterized membrane protein required for colicin V production